ncbi:MAG: hypothetical protein WC943_11340 [Elusimicrobiota bacterium]|jgi:hypothetical protein
MNKPAKPFRIIIMSHDEHEELIASIECEGQGVAVICQDLGPDRLEIFLFPRSDGMPWRFDFSDLQAAITDAKGKLLQDK